MKRSIHPVLFVFLALFLLSGARASAGDYKVAYAFDAGDINDAGKLEDCTYAQICVIKSEKLNLSIWLGFYKSDHADVDVDVVGGRGRSGCCYFNDGEHSVQRKITGSLIRLHVYEGRARIRNEFIQNTSLGFLYLQFSDMK